jgi:hypothetical protein
MTEREPEEPLTASLHDDAHSSAPELANDLIPADLHGEILATSAALTRPGRARADPTEGLTQA